MTQKNLIPFAERTEEEQRAIRSKGGKASGEARRARKAFKEVVAAVLEYNPTEAALKPLQEWILLEHPDMNTEEAIALAQIVKAIQGDTSAAAWVRDTAGDKPSDNLNIGTDFSINVSLCDE